MQHTSKMLIAISLISQPVAATLYTISHAPTNGRFSARHNVKKSKSTRMEKRTGEIHLCICTSMDMCCSSTLPKEQRYLFESQKSKIHILFLFVMCVSVAALWTDLWALGSSGTTEINIFHHFVEISFVRFIFLVVAAAVAVVSAQTMQFYCTHIRDSVQDDYTFISLYIF